MATQMVPLLIMVGSGGESEVERMVAGAQQAIAMDTIEKALAAACFEPIIVATNALPLGASSGSWLSSTSSKGSFI